MQTGKRPPGLFNQTFGGCVRQITQPARQMNKVLRFTQRCSGNIKKMQVVLFAVARRSLGNICRHGIRSASQLAGQAMDFPAWKRLSGLINSHSEIIRRFPSFNFCVVPHGLVVRCPVVSGLLCLGHAISTYVRAVRLKFHRPVKRTAAVTPTDQKPAPQDRVP